MSSDKIWYEKLIDKYPLIFKNLKHLECESGWEELIDTLCDTIEYYLKTLPEDKRSEVYASQIKEKFGGLRFYMTFEGDNHDFINGAIAQAEFMSFKICQFCGEKGSKKVHKRWHFTVCEKHFEEIVNK